MPVVLLDAAGRRRSPATLPGFHCGRAPRNKGRRYPADPPTVEEIVAVMRQAGGGVDADRARGLIVVLWRAGLRISEALALLESDLDSRRGSILVRRGKGGSAERSGWTRGGGSSSARGWAIVCGCQPAHCSVWCMARRRAAPARRPRCAHSLRAWRDRPACDDASPRISFVTRTPWRWLARAYRCWSSNASSDTSTSASSRSTSRASTTAKSSTRFIRGAHRRSQRASACVCSPHADAEAGTSARRASTSLVSGRCSGCFMP
jgi:hypothetical protein